MNRATAADLSSIAATLPNPGRVERYKNLTGRDAP